MLLGSVEEVLNSDYLQKKTGRINLIFTSPPFALNRKKRYGNKRGDAYKSWLEELAPQLADLLAPDGSIVIELGNAWEGGKPIMSTLPMETLIGFAKKGRLHICQQFVCHNPARLPGPIQWVNVERIRVKDSYTHVWWLSRSEKPKADNRKVLIPYGPDMEQLLKAKRYNPGARPSGHVIGARSFFKDNGGAISSNVIDPASNEERAVPPNLLQFSNTAWSAHYREYCKRRDLKPHPARMQPGLAAFFISFLTDEKDLVLDPFAGSNTTGAVAQQLRRRWIGIEPEKKYIEGSKGRFPRWSKVGRRETR